MVKVTPEEFELWTGLIYELTGIVLTANKTYLVENRLNDLLAETGSPSFKDLYFKCRYADAVGLREKSSAVFPPRRPVFSEIRMFIRH